MSAHGVPDGVQQVEPAGPGNARRTWNRDLWGGALVALLGLGTLIQGGSYRVGTLARMGPGFFPIALGSILACVGLCIMLAARLSAPALPAPRLAPEWRAWALICLSIVAFVVVGIYGGLVPATFAIVFISALADRSNTIVNALVLSLALVAICMIVFWWLLQMQFPLFRWG